MNASNGSFQRQQSTYAGGGMINPPAPIPVDDPAPDPVIISTSTIADAIVQFMRAVISVSGFVPSPALLLLIGTGIPALVIVIQAARSALPAQYGVMCSVAIVALGIIESALSHASGVAKARLATQAAIEHERLTHEMNAAQLSHHVEIARIRAGIA